MYKAALMANPNRKFGSKPPRVLEPSTSDDYYSLSIEDKKKWQYVVKNGKCVIDPTFDWRVDFQKKIEYAMKEFKCGPPPVSYRMHHRLDALSSDDKRRLVDWNGLQFIDTDLGVCNCTFIWHHKKHVYYPTPWWDINPEPELRFEDLDRHEFIFQ